MTTFPEKIIKDAERLAERLRTAKRESSFLDTTSKIEFNNTFETIENFETNRTI
ncbi:unnamed protein product [Meloidogyne enterolobii]